MSGYELIPEEAYENLPSDAHDKFVVLVRTAQANLARLLDNSSSGDFDSEIRSQFISIISGIADALGIEGLPKLEHRLNNYESYQTFQVHLAGVVAKVRLAGNLVAKPYSVELGRVTRARIHQEIGRLRFSVEQSDLPEKKRQALLDKLSDLEEELAKQRMSFARTMAIAASIMTVVGGGTAALANAPKAGEAVLTIIRLIGEDKEREEAERRRLSPPPKALPNPARQKEQPPDAFNTDLDDDVPF